MKSLRTRAAIPLAALLLITGACGQVSDLDEQVETASEQRDVSGTAVDTTAAETLLARGDAGGTDIAPSTDRASATTPATSAGRGGTAEQLTEPHLLEGAAATTTEVIPSLPESSEDTDPAGESAESTTTAPAETTVAPTTEPDTASDDVDQPAATSTSTSTSTTSPTLTTDAPTTTEAPTSEAPTTTAAAPATTAAPTTTIQEAVAVPDPVPSAASGTARVAMVAGQSINVYGDATDTTADWTFGRATQFGNPTVFLVAGASGSRLKILLPVRQKHTYGWIDEADVTISTTDFRAVVDLSSRSVNVYSGTALVTSSQAVIGKSSTPTPVGQFYVTDKLRHANPSGGYGPWILALSARSEALTSFNGGEPIVALHGTNKPWLVGGRHSNGCIRLPNDVITELAQLVPLGTPVDVVA